MSVLDPCKYKYTHHFNNTVFLLILYFYIYKNNMKVSKGWRRMMAFRYVWYVYVTIHPTEACGTVWCVDKQAVERWREIISFYLQVCVSYIVVVHELGALTSQSAGE